MRVRSTFLALTCVLLSSAWLARAEEAAAPTPAERLSGAVRMLSLLLEPDADAPPRTFTGRMEILKAGGLPKAVAGQGADLALQGPDHLRLSASVKNSTYSIGRDGQQLWLHVTDKKFGVLGKPGVPRFATAPEKIDQTRMGPIKLPLPREQLALLPLLLNVESKGLETNDGVRCHILQATPKPEALQALKIPKGRLTLAVRDSDSLPVMLGYNDDKGIEVEIRLREPRWNDPWTAGQWKIPAREGDRIETTAVSHILRFAETAIGALSQKIPSLGPANGERRLVATEGEGRLEMHDGTRVLFLKGTPEDMGRQQGALLKKEIRNLVNAILYGVGVGSSFSKGRWFFGEIEAAQGRLMPFMDDRYVREMDAIALATRHDKEEIRLANFFPELFHCSGFALFGDATAGGKLYHGRILDYLKGVGLEQNAVVVVVRPDQGHAWANVSYAGFIGTVTAMNEKKVAIGEMGGRGEGNWDGKPMAQLLREVMEKADTLDEAVEILRKGPRTCEYYYVITDGKTKRAVGIAATPSKFETVWAGESHPQLPDPVKDAVLMSAGDRYKQLVRRVKDGYGKIDSAGALDLMKRPVCMNSNIHSVLFEPETLDFWVANADSKNPASHTRFTRYNLAELLKAPPVDGTSAAAK